MRPDDGSEIESFQSLQEFAKLTTKPAFDSKEAIVCRTDDFINKNGRKKTHTWDEFKELPKQCWCEPQPKYEPYHCSADGGQCSCKKGVVFYGAKYKAGTTKLANFEDVTS